MELGNPGALEFRASSCSFAGARAGALRARADPRASTARLRARFHALALALLSGALGCAAPAANPPLVGASQGTIAAGAAITAVAAGALWAVGGGCKLQGCPYGSYCNKKTGFCDVRRCDQGCPDGTICNEGLGRCQVAPPPALPTDLLPQDDARLPPGTH